MARHHERGQSAGRLVKLSHNNSLNARFNNDAANNDAAILPSIYHTIKTLRITNVNGFR